MKQLQHLLDRYGFDGIMIVVLGFVAIVVNVYSLIVGGQVIQPLLTAVLALLLVEVVLQRGRLEKSKEEIINSLKGVRIEVFPSDKEFADAKYKQLLATNDFVYDTELCKPAVASRPSGYPDAENPYRKLLNERVVKGNLTFKYVQVIYNRDQFEQVLQKLFRFYKYDYFIGYFVGAPEIVPVLNLMVFDDKHFFLGGYYGSSARGESRNVYIQHDLVGRSLRQYFDYLWSKARLLNENRRITWNEVFDCGTKLGYPPEELNSTIAQIAKEAGLSEIPTFKQ